MFCATFIFQTRSRAAILLCSVVAVQFSFVQWRLSVPAFSQAAAISVVQVDA